jgi:hypothetical protein
MLFVAAVPIERDRPLLDGKLIPQPLRGEMKIDVNLPIEARQLMADLHHDRQLIAGGFCVVLVLLAVVAFKYFIDWRRLAPVAKKE